MASTEKDSIIPDVIKKRALKIASGPVAATASDNAKGSAKISNLVGGIKAIDGSEEATDIIKDAAKRGDYTVVINVTINTRRKVVNELVRKKYLVVGIGKNSNESSIDRLLVGWYGKTAARKSAVGGRESDKVLKLADEFVREIDKQKEKAGKNYIGAIYYNPRITDSKASREDIIKAVASKIKLLP